MSVFINALFISSWNLLYPVYIIRLYFCSRTWVMSLATAEFLVQITILSRMLCQPPKN